MKVFGLSSIHTPGIVGCGIGEMNKNAESGSFIMAHCCTVSDNKAMLTLQSTNYGERPLIHNVHNRIYTYMNTTGWSDPKFSIRRCFRHADILSIKSM